jgi:hypothetical protein
MSSLKNYHSFVKQHLTMKKYIKMSGKQRLAVIRKKWHETKSKDNAEAEMSMKGQAEETLLPMPEWKVTIVTFNQGEAWKKSEIQESESMIVEQFFLEHETSDIFVLGLQEANEKLVTLVNNFLSNNRFKMLQSTSRKQPSLGTIGLYIWLNASIYEQFQSTVTHYHANCGDSVNKTLNLVGQMLKGGIYTNVQIGNQNLVFANCHLPSNAEHIDARTTCLMNICDHIKSSMKGKPYKMFLFGDLNYRTSQVDKVKDDAEKLAIHNYQCLKVGDLPSNMVFHDQLDKELLKLQNDYDLREPERYFCPTCRFLEHAIHIDEASQRVYDTKRIPSWCDRILFQGGSSITPIEYKSKIITLGSDHNAVYASFYINDDTFEL